MRTTIELSPAHRARLLELAARRGQKGFSGVIDEAIEAYLAHEHAREDDRRRALALRGSLSVRAAADLRQSTTAFRSTWR